MTDTGQVDTTLGVSGPPLRYYSIGMIGAGSFLGGPLAGCWFIGHNWKVLDDPGACFRTKLTGFVATQLMFSGVMFLPDKFPSEALPLAYIAALSGYARATQKDKLEALKVKGALPYTGWSVVWRALLSLFVTVVVFFAVYSAVDMAFPGFWPPMDDGK